MLSRRLNMRDDNSRWKPEFCCQIHDRGPCAACPGRLFCEEIVFSAARMRMSWRATNGRGRVLNAAAQMASTPFDGKRSSLAYGSTCA
ncbi:uncharacterized protein ARMOST_18798 [Armillaria ostoyae]|uniref:Uncharacterized protein n=1 Tax=Armillaria ostoyae TaxID=47428 RepID=A0A284S2T1_ARMOS|nr:uncharacterized protein ARMOST_18798 [Armillaria ostoyae]